MAGDGDSGFADGAVTAVAAIQGQAIGDGLAVSESLVPRRRQR